MVRRTSNAVHHSRRARRTTSAATAVALVCGLLSIAEPAGAAPVAGTTTPHSMPLGSPVANSSPSTQKPPPLTPLPPVSPGATGDNRPSMTGSPADTPIAALPAIDPGPDGAPVVPQAPVTQNLPVTPSPITLATQPGQTLVDATANDALNTMAAEGPYVVGGAPSLDANQLQPQVKSAQFIDPANPPTLQNFTNAFLAGNYLPILPIDPLALLQQLPNGIPQVTYRVCSESATKPVSCSLTLPLGVPQIMNVTGNGTPASPDRTPDIMADLVPAAGVGTIVTASNQLLNDQTLLAGAQADLAALKTALQNPLYLLTHPLALIQVVTLQNTVNALQQTVQNDLSALLGLINVGLAFMQMRMGTSEIPAGTPIRAHVWAVYDIPGYHRLSIGFDGYRRGAGLTQNSLGIFTLSPAQILRGVFDVNADLFSARGPAMAITAGISSITQDSAGTTFDPTVASVRFNPTPSSFLAHAVIDPTTETDSVDARTDVRTQLDALVFSNRHSGSPAVDQYTQVKIDTLPYTVSAIMHRPTSGGSTTVSYRASSTIDNVLFANYQYAGSTLQHAIQANAVGVPASIDVALNTGGDAMTGSYVASSSLTALGLNFYDQSASISGSTGPIVARGALSGLPKNIGLLFDRVAKHVQITTDTALTAASLQASYKLGDYAPLPGDHATYIANGKAFGIDARISGFKSLDAYYDTDTRVTLAFDPGGQSFAAAGIIDGHQKVRADISNLPANLSAELDTVNRKFNYTASTVIDRVTAAYVDTTNGPSISARIDKIPTSVHASWDLGSAPHINYQASSSIPLVQFFASPQGVETVAPYGNDYISAAITDIPATMDLLLDFPNGHAEGTNSAALGSVTVAARAPFAGREWTAMGSLTSIPAHFTADFANGSFDFKAISGPLGSASLTVSNHQDPFEPTSPAHLAVHYNQLSGDLDASAGILNLTEVGYTNVNSVQHLILQADEGTNPMQIDANVVLGSGGVADTLLSAFGEITGLPSNVDVTFGSGKITYSADKHIGILLGIRVGKIKALTGLGAPLPTNGIAAVAKSCATGPGCASDSSPFCSAFPSCLGAVANINMSGLPTSVVVDTVARTVAFTSYQPPVSTLTLYVRLIGLVSLLPDVSARVTLSGLPSSLDFTAGPFDFATGDPTSFDAKYNASAPLGDLSVDVNATTTNATFPVLRANASIVGIPASFHMTGSFGSVTHITLDDSAPITSISAKVTNASSGYLSASVTGVPMKADFKLDLPTRHVDATMSSAISNITVIGHVPFGGRTWNAYAQATAVPGQFTADFLDGAYRFKALSGPLGTATFAVSNFVGAQVPSTSRYLTVHYDQLTGNVDAGASIAQLSDIEYSKAGNGNQTFGLDMGAATVGLDANVVLTSGGARDTRFSAGGTITTPNSVHVNISNGHIVYQADQSAALALSASIGKVKALSGLAAPLYSQGVSAVASSCASGAGCASDTSIFCTVFSSCFGAVANVNLPGLPTKVDIDTNAGTVQIVGLHPTGVLKVYGELDGLISGVPQVRALATLTGLPSTLDITVGPFGQDKTDPTKVVAGYTASAGLGTLTVDADAQTTSSFGTLRGRLFASNLPATFSVSGKFGSQTHIHVANSSRIDELSVQATATLLGSPASGLIDFTDIPAHFDMDIGAVTTAEGVNIPTFTYDTPDPLPVNSGLRLDGLAQLDASLTQNVGPAGIGTDGAFFRFTNLGEHTTVTVNPSTFTLNMASTGDDSDLFQVGANLRVNDIPNTDFSKQVFDEIGFQGYIEGHYGARPSKIDDLELIISNMKSVQVEPGNAPFGLPSEVGLLFPGVSGDYGTFSLYTNGVDLHPDVTVWFRVNDPIFIDHYPFGTISLPTNITDLWFHRYDSNGPKTFAQINLLVVCVDFKVNPEDVGKSDNFVTLSGSDGPQSFNFLDINDIVPDILVSLAGAYTSPFMPIDISTDASAGPC